MTEPGPTAATVDEQQTGNGRVETDPAGIKALIASSRRSERTVAICLRGDLQATFEDLERQLAEIERTPRPVDHRLTGPVPPPGARQVAEQIQALRKQMQAATVIFRLRALSPRAWDDLAAAHPPRKTDDGGVHPSDIIGVNSATFFTPLIRACTVAPVLDDDDWAMLLGDGEHGLTNRQFEELGEAAWAQNRRSVDIPFSRAASALMASFEPG